MTHKKKRIITAVCVLIGALFVVGITAAVAATTYGSSDDPLVTLSYINQTVKPDIMKELNANLEATKAELAADFNSRLSQANGNTGGAVSPDAFTPVTLSARQVIRCSAGAEILVSSGGATAYGGSSPRLTDETDGTSLAAAGANLINNHMYIVPAEGNGLRAASDGTVVMVRGGYTVYSNL